MRRHQVKAAILVEHLLVGRDGRQPQFTQRGDFLVKGQHGRRVDFQAAAQHADHDRFAGLCILGQHHVTQRSVGQIFTCAVAVMQNHQAHRGSGKRQPPIIPGSPGRPQTTLHRNSRRFYPVEKRLSRGLPAVQTTVRYTQASRQQIRDKLRLLSG